MTRELPETCTFREFAELVPCRPSWVTQLRQAGRLVLDESGKRVKVRESLQRIEDTRDPAKGAVAARHAAERQQDEPAPAADPSEPEGQGEGGWPDKATPGFQHWRERRERAQALREERENALAEGKLIPTDRVDGAIANHTATLRTRLEALPDILAPQLVAVRDESKARAMLAEAIEHALGELARGFSEVKGATV